MPLLVGRHVNKIDRKGRVSVPKQFRDALQTDVTELLGVYVYPSFKSPMIEACGEEFMTRIADSIDHFALFSDDQIDLAQSILHSAHTLPFDPEGRVVIPEELRAHAAIDGEALFVGGGRNRFQIWCPEVFERHRLEAIERARSRGATLPLQPRVEVRP